MKRFKLIILIEIIVCLLCASPSVAFHGTIRKDTTLHGRVLIDGDIVVPHGKTLTIAPGSIIIFTPKESKYEVVKDGLCNIVVYGRLMCIGETSANIWIGTPAYENGKQIPGWGGIMFYNTTPSTIQYTNIRYATVGIGVNTASVLKIQHVHISDNEIGIYLKRATQTHIKYSTLSQNFKGIIVSTNKTLPIQFNEVKENTIGILLRDANYTHILQDKINKNGIGIAIIDSRNTSIEKSTFKHNVWGIAISNSRENLTNISKSLFMFNYIGIVGFESSQINSTGNEFQVNSIAIALTDRATVNESEKRSNFIGNKKGIYYYSKGYYIPNTKY